jgi:hypothetical protein
MDTPSTFFSLLSPIDILCRLFTIHYFLLGLVSRHHCDLISDLHVASNGGYVLAIGFQ